MSMEAFLVAALALLASGSMLFFVCLVYVILDDWVFVGWYVVTQVGGVIFAIILDGSVLVQPDASVVGFVQPVIIQSYVLQLYLVAVRLRAGLDGMRKGKLPDPLSVQKL